MRAAAAPYVLLRTGDRLISAGLRLRMRSQKGEETIDVANAQSALFDANRAGHVTARMWDDHVIAGELAGARLRVSFGSDGPAADVNVAQVHSIRNFAPRPPAEVERKVQALVAELGSDSFRRREAAQEALIALGRGILPLLEKHRASDDPEVRARIEAVFKALAG